MKAKRPTIAVDFDGVIHNFDAPYQSWRLRLPLPGAQAGLRQLLDDGFTIVIHTERAKSPSGLAMVREWLDEYDMPYHDITAVKPHAVLFLDDRAVRFRDWQDALIKVDLLTPAGML